MFPNVFWYYSEQSYLEWKIQVLTNDTMISEIFRTSVLKKIFAWVFLDIKSWIKCVRIKIIVLSLVLFWFLLQYQICSPSKADGICLHVLYHRPFPKSMRLSVWSLKFQGEFGNTGLDVSHKIIRTAFSSKPL